MRNARVPEMHRGWPPGSAARPRAPLSNPPGVTWALLRKPLQGYGPGARETLQRKWLVRRACGDRGAACPGLRGRHEARSRRREEMEGPSPMGRRIEARRKRRKLEGLVRGPRPMSPSAEPLLPRVASAATPPRSRPFPGPSSPGTMTSTAGWIRVRPSRPSGSSATYGRGALNPRDIPVPFKKRRSAGPARDWSRRQSGFAHSSNGGRGRLDAEETDRPLPAGQHPRVPGLRPAAVL